MKRKDSKATCSATNCPTTELNEDCTTLFPFPTKHSRYRQWLRNAGLQTLMQRSSKRPRSYHLCSRHFEDDQFLNATKTVLKENALPTIFHTLTAPVVNVQSVCSMKQEDRNNKEVYHSNSKDGMVSTGSPPDSSNGSLQVQGQANQRSTGNTHCQWCSAINCTNSRNRRPGLSFFRFPLEPERCKKWIKNSQRFDLGEKSVKALHNGGYMMCSEHFEQNCITISANSSRRRRLFNWAVPTIFNFSISTRKTKKPTPTFPACSDKVRSSVCVTGGDEPEGLQKSKRQQTRSLKRKHKAIEVQPEEKETKRLPTMKELREENLSLSEKVHQLAGSRLEIMRRLSEVETRIEAVKEYARINVDVLCRALDTSKHWSAEQEFERLRSVIQLLADEEEVGYTSEGGDTVSCDSLQ